MSIHLTCPQGHQWDQADASAPNLDKTQALCPICGGPAQVLTGTTSDLIENLPLGSWPNLGKPPPHDPAATIPASDLEALQRQSLDLDGTISQAAEVTPEIRESVPGYHILAELGRGGMGVVYKARHIGLRRLVALKMVLAGVHLGPGDLLRFQSEAAAVAGLHHLHIVQIYEIGQHEGRPYFSLEYVEGGSLAQKLRHGPLPPLEAADLLEKLARAMHYAHQRGIVHRDLKPANILLTADGQPKITDFGLAKQIRSGTQHTQTGTVMGTPSYMAPEQAMGRVREVGPVSDIYALGAILYEMLCGRPPFRSETPLDTMLQVASQDPEPLSRLQPRLPIDLQTICMKCLEKEPRKRYASGAELADDLQRFLKGEPIHARPVGALERAVKWARRRPAVAALLALTLVSVLVGFVTVTWLWKKEAEQRANLETAQQELALTLERMEATLYRNRIALAEREWLANNLARARFLLRECPYDLRGWEWHYLHRLCHADLITLRGHDCSVFSLAFSGDGKRLVSASNDQTVKVWDTTAGKVLFTHHGPPHMDRGVTAVYSLDSKHILFAGAQQNVQTLDALTGQARAVQHRPPGRAYCMSFSPDRKRLAAGRMDGTVHVWDLESKTGFLLQGHPGVVQAVAFAPHGKLLASAGQNGLVKVWDLPSGMAITTIDHQKASVNGLAFSPDGRRLASAGNDATVRVWEALSGKPITVFRGHHHPVLCVAFHPRGTAIASAGRDQVIKIWNPVTGEERFSLRGHTDRINCLAFSPDGQLLASAGEDRLVKVWDATTAQETRTFRTRFAGNCAAIAPDGKTLATADNYVQFWNPTTTQPLGTLGGMAELIRSLAFHPDGRTLATAGRTLKIRELATGKDRWVLGPPNLHHRSVAYSPDGQRLVSGGDDGVVRLWDTQTGKEVHAFTGHQGAILSVAYSPNGQWIASASADRTIKVWEVATGQLIWTLTGHTGKVNSVAFSPDGRWLASGGDGQAGVDSESLAEGELKLWDLAAGAEVRSLLGHTSVVLCVAFSPDGSRLASGSLDQTVKIWELNFGQELLTLRGHNSGVLGVVFSPDGNLLVTLTQDEMGRVWNAHPLP